MALEDLQLLYQKIATNTVPLEVVRGVQTPDDFIPFGINLSHTEFIQLRGVDFELYARSVRVQRQMSAIRDEIRYLMDAKTGRLMMIRYPFGAPSNPVSTHETYELIPADPSEMYVQQRMPANSQSTPVSRQAMISLRGAQLISADLRNVDLSGIDLSGANLQDADLRDADLREADLTGVNLQGAKLSGVKWK